MRKDVLGKSQLTHETAWEEISPAGFSWKDYFGGFVIQCSNCSAGGYIFSIIDKFPGEHPKYH